ncbi:peptidase_S8 domain-containing protein [Haematococcus lacustris]|uniref:Peptidase_S8 domain-containing protein n=1 Tax=Haematococcus lacustris TaxID=44745 RepID=A0A6A0AE54_HAELA|nr:peptidase_S8 domain-containing protein [Haematococcus lacustris]
MDWPAFPGVGPTLVNNLDLRVTTPSGAVLWGNDVRGGDRMNNVEKLVIPRPQSGVYFIQVDATNLFIDARPQPYSLVDV